MGLKAATLKKRERESKMAKQTNIKRERDWLDSLGGRDRAQKAHMGKEGGNVGWIVEVYRMNFKERPFIMHNWRKSQSWRSSTYTTHTQTHWAL